MFADMYLRVLVLLGLLIHAHAQTYTMQILSQPSKCLGGSPCTVQPQIAVLKDGEIDLAYSGSVYATMSTSPSGLEPLWVGECNLSNNCGQKVSGATATFYFFNGIAKFQNLMVKTVGTGYSLKFTLKNNNGFDIAYTFSGQFEVTSGPIFKIFLVQEVGSATGGSAFSPNPVLAIADRGSNTLLDVSSGTITAFMQKSPLASTKLNPISRLVTPIKSGIAAFTGLYINEAGGPYQLYFVCDLSYLPAFPLTAAGTSLPTIYSNEFYISVGLPAKLTFVSGTEIKNDVVFAGEYFISVPRIEVKDAGDNIVVEDFTSAIRATISDNPSKSILGDPGSLFPIARAGIVTFSTFTIDKAGRDFRLAFALSTFSQLTNAYTETSIVLYSARFDVKIGPPRVLSTFVAADVAWAGGLPIEIQPVLKLLDYGGNVLTSEFAADVTCQLIPSLSFTSTIEVDSSFTDNTFVQTVTSSLVPRWDDEYGAGSVVDIVLNFNFEVWLTYPNPFIPPTIELTATDSGGTRRHASLDTTQDITRVNSLRFLYAVQAGDMLAANTFLDVYSANNDNKGNINLQGGSLLNGNNKVVSLVIPTDLPESLDGQLLVVDTSAPSAWNMTTPTGSGEYGVGEVIELFIHFDAPVIAVGLPYLELTITDVNNVQIQAPYNRSVTGSRNSILVFQYTVEVGDTGTGLTLNNNNILYPDANSYIRRESDSLTTDINSVLTDRATGNTITSVFAGAFSINIDTTVPTLDGTFGIQTDGPTTSSFQYPGDKFPIYIKFTKPIQVMNLGLTLTMRCGAFDFPAVYKETASDDKTIEFTFTVPSGVNTADLDIVPGSEALLSSVQTNFIKRKSTRPSQNVDGSTLAIYSSNSKSFKDLNQVYLKGWTPTIQSVALLSTSSGLSPLEPDDFALIAVTFDLPVQMSCNPVLIILLNPSFGSDGMPTREAAYHSGNGGNIITFKYTVAFGDVSTGLQYRYTPGAFCYKSGCVQDSCTIKIASAAPETLASVAMPITPIPSLSPTFGVYIDANFNVQATSSLGSPRATTIVQITTRWINAVGTYGNYQSSAGEYGAGNVIHFDVEFTDDVIFASGSTVYPELNLNIYNEWSVGAAIVQDRKNATFVGGFGTKVLTFMHNVVPGDDVASLVPEDIPDGAGGHNSPLVCYSARGCNIENRNNAAVDLSQGPGGYIVDGGIEIDTSVPFITKVWTHKNTSIYDRIYTVGEVIDIHVRWNKPILITGRMPRLLMDVETPERYAVWNSVESALHSDDEFVLTYTVGQGDMAKNLTYVGGNLDRVFGLCTIYRKASTPTTEVSYLLPNAVSPRPISDEAHFQFVLIDTFSTAYITSVDYVTAPGFYVAGDVIVFKVVFSLPVILGGRATVHINMGNHVKSAVYIGDSSGYSISVIPTLPSQASKLFYFKVLVAENDFNPRLDYTDRFAFFINKNDLGGAGYLKHASSTPTKECKYDLPKPGTSGSLSDPEMGAPIVVNGAAALMTGVGFVNAPGLYYAGSIIIVAMDFTINVVVTGFPSIVLNVAVEGIPREAIYYQGSGTSRILFKYVVQPGDKVPVLDYLGNRQLFNSAKDSFRYNGGEIKALSRAPTTNALIYLNPPFGQIGGTTTIGATAGVFNFLDLSIKKRGNDYMMRFLSSPPAANRTLSTTQTIFVSFSNEFELVPKEAQKSDLIGTDVDIQRNFAAIGAPASNVSVNSIQTITTIAKDPFLVPLHTVQIVGTKAIRQPFIESFHTTGDVGSTVAGTFRLYHNDHTGGTATGYTRSIPVNVQPGGLVAVLNADLPHLGRVTVTREAYIFCACDNAFTWTITFHDLTAGNVPSILFQTDGLEGSSAMVGPKRLQEAAYMGGQFKLNVLGKQTGYIQYDASATDVVQALHKVGVMTIDVTMVQVAENPARERFWRITFDHYLKSYDVPLMTSTYTNSVLTGLTGNGAHVYHTTIQKGVHGPGGYNGGFKLSWRGNTTVHIAHDASAETVKAALIALPIINYVNVNRSEATSQNGFTWSVEFVDVNFNTPRGYQRAVVANLEPMTVINEMIGTNIDVRIGSHYTQDDELRRYQNARSGTFGRSAGAVYLYERDGEVWDQVATLRGNDTSAFDQFGSSVSLDSFGGGGEIVVVGAVGADMNGVYEKQAISCVADAGTFTLSFRGWTSKAIPWDVTKEKLQGFIDSDANFFSDGIYSIQTVDIDDWGTGTGKNVNFCSNNTAVITFRAPLNRIDPLTSVVTDVADIAVLSVTSSLTLGGSSANAVLASWQLQKGTTRVHGPNADLQQHGAAYIFRATCDPGSSLCFDRKWVQEAQLFPMPAPGETSDRFGHATSVWKNLIAIGAPGGAAGRGHVYVYEGGFQEEGVSRIRKYRWNLLQRILVEATVAGDEFGFSLDIEEDTLVMSAPNMGGKGAVFIYRRAGSGQKFKLSQEPKPNMVAYPLRTGDMFGYSIAVNDKYLIIGAPGSDAATINLGRIPNAKDTDTGAVYVFYRVSRTGLFEFTQALNPSNVRRNDRFGWAVDIQSTTIVASSVEHYGGALNASRAIIEVKTTGKYSDVPIGNSFALSWRSRNTTGEYVPISTRPIAHDASAADLEAIMEADLNCGNVLVSRSEKDIYNNGYSWMITFMAQKEAVPLLQADASLLTGTEARVEIGYVNMFPPEVRGISHIFEKSRIETKYHSNGDFIEEVFVNPFAYQGTDRCGSSVAIAYGYALIGCPNRDSFIPNKNSGAASIFNLNLLDLQFSTQEYIATEGNAQELMVVTRDTSAGFQIPADALFYIESVDRNAPQRRQTFLRNLFGVDAADVPLDKTVADMTGNSGIAIGRSQYYGSVHNDSKWIGGVYDYRGISDYVPISAASAYLVEARNMTQRLVTTADTRLEFPNENVTVAIHSPGLWPSPLGRLYTTVNIVDDEDGRPNDEFQFNKVYEDGATAGSRIGYSVSVHSATNFMVTGSPTGFRVTAAATIGAPPDRLQCGVVVIFKKNNVGKYIEQEKLFSPNAALGNRFGDSVLLRTAYLTGTALLVVSEPNAVKVHVWYYNGGSFSYEKLLTAPEATTYNDRFGAHGALGLDRNLLVVGAPGAEAIFLYIREFSGGQWGWSASTLIRSSDFDYDIIFTKVLPHRQEFGASVSVSGRVIAVGSPFADYAKTGSDLVEVDVNTEGTDIKAYGRGKVYTFYTSPAIESFTVYAPTQLTAGSFVLDFTGYGSTTTTSSLPFGSAALVVENALKTLSNVNDVRVSSQSGPITGGYQYSWTITFLSEYTSPSGNLVPKWNGFGCPGCTAFSHLTSNPADQIKLGASVPMSIIREQQKMTASDKDLGYRFGSSLALDNDQLVVGSEWAAGNTISDWDFETGSLLGWGRTGTAFDYQPTHGDNSYLRPVYTPTDESTGIRAVPESSRLQGRYYIGTYEKRPGNPTNYEVADSRYYQGQTQGDAPQGTLNSNVFMIKGDQITFLIGGGCQKANVYVELKIDGLSVARHTGQCSERMDEVFFDTSLYLGRAGQIRIVDSSSGKWGHINVDNFQFSWDVSGRRLDSTTGRMAETGKVETPRAGAVYAFHLTTPNSNNLCAGNKFNCVWYEEARLMASDKRENALFGASVAVNDLTGVIIVGSPAAAMTGFWKEQPHPYPFRDEFGGSSDVNAVDMPMDSQYMIQFQNDPLMGALANGGRGVWYDMERQNKGYQAIKDLDDYSYSNAGAGAIYVFKKDHAVIAGSGSVDVVQHWYYTEHTKVQGSDGTAMDAFGSSVAIDGNTIVVGAVGNDGYQPDAGAVYLYNSGFAAASFQEDEFEALEGTHAYMQISVTRNPLIYSGRLVLEYATSDLTATGVDTARFDECMALATNLRGPSKCGDYEQTSGIIVIPVGSNTAGFTIRIMNDLCHERFLKYAQITLSVPGAGALQGNAMSARLRIDDDDFLEKECFWTK